MNREEKINIIKTKFKDAIKLDFDCGGKYEGCSDCPLYKVNNGEYVYNCSEIDADQELLGQAWSESHGYIKQESMPKVNEVFVEDLATLLQRGATFSSIENGLGREGEIWMGQDDQKDNWYKWIMKNLFVEDTEEVKPSNEETESTVPINLGEVQSQEQFPFDDIPVSDFTIPIPQPTTPELKWGFLKETLKVLIQEERSQAQKEAYQKILKIMDGFDGVA